MRITKLFRDFFESEKVGGIILIICTLTSLILTNSRLGISYVHIWHITLFDQPLEYWINDGLMTIFFLLIGLELEREIYLGELSNIKEALLPTFAAIGGMIIPAGIFLFINSGTNTQSGAGIPMATDIAFALGVLSLLGKRVPMSLKIFLTALAVIDDLGAILIIAIFYTKVIFWINLLIALIILVLLFILKKIRVTQLLPYIIGGIIMWYFMLNSGIHTTITGVLLAFVIPFEKGNKSTSYILQNLLHKPVAFFILPLFALANTAINLDIDFREIISQKYSLGIILGLVIGKPIGIILFSFMGIALGLYKLPPKTNWKLIFGIGLLGGIGFTMSIFISLLAYTDYTMINHSKLCILIASLLSGVLGYIVLSLTLKKQSYQND